MSSLRRKTPKIVLTFATTSDAMALETAARDQGLPGRMIPVPSELSASCGLAWCIPVEEWSAFQQFTEARYEGKFELELY